MSQADREKWNARYADEKQPPSEPSNFLTSLDEHLPQRGRGLDIAGGGGRNSIWLAKRGLDMTLVDISGIGLAVAERRAQQQQLPLNTLECDLKDDPFPAGEWDVIVSCYYLQRSLFSQFPRVLSVGGALVFQHPTRKNLQRHEKPPARFLLDDGELPQLVEGLEVVRYEEGWLDGGRHEARLIARRVE